MNPISAATWSWRALRGHSITFSVLFACSALGISVVSRFREFLGHSGAPWYILLIAPIILVGFLAKKETTWVPEPMERRKWARRIFFGSIAAAVLIAFATPAPPPDPAAKPVTPPTFHKVPH